MDMETLKVDGLTKQFGSFKAVDNISFSVKEGEIVGFLGPNGAGKTTTIQMLLGITTPTAGSIAYFGHDFFRYPRRALEKINFTSAFNNLQGRMSTWENMLVFSHLYGVKDPEPKIRRLVKEFNMEEYVNKRYWDLSTGQRTRANFIKALLNDPKLILMDEPTASLDPDVADRTLSYIEKLRKDRQITVLYTSHNMTEVTRICDRAIFIDRGRIVAHDTPLGLTRRIQEAQLRLTFNEGASTIRDYLLSQKQEFRFEGEHVVYVKPEEKLIPKIIFGLSKVGIYMTDIEIKKPTLEHVFLQIARGHSHVFSQD